jgi:hypothetical protein
MTELSLHSRISNKQLVPRNSSSTLSLSSTVCSDELCRYGSLSVLCLTVSHAAAVDTLLA